RRRWWIPGLQLGLPRGPGIGSNVFEARLLALLKRPHIGDGRPTILHSDLVAIGHHRVTTMGDRIGDLSIGHLALFVLVLVRDAQQAMLGRDSGPLSCCPLSNRTVDPEHPMPPRQKALRNRKGYAGSPPSTHLSGVHIAIAYPKLPEWRTDFGRWNSGILH